MSVYATEVLGYYHEVWERTSEPELVDPLTYLYQSRPRLVTFFADCTETKRSLEIAVAI